jgi:hypothetical protein
MLLEAVSKTQEQGATEARTRVYIGVNEDRSRPSNAAIVFFETASNEKIQPLILEAPHL